MDAINLLGTLLGGRQVVSPSGRRVLQNNHPAFRGGAAPARQGGGLGGLLAGAAKVYAARQAAEAQQRAAQAQHQARQRAHYGAHNHCPDDFGGLSYDHANQRALLLVRAMIYAARADGLVDKLEEAAIVQQFGPHVSNAEMEFIRQEVHRPMNLPHFAREIPRGLEDDVYSASLLAINLDNQAEARYLHELAHELRLPHQHCNQLHQHYGEPIIFR